MFSKNQDLNKAIKTVWQIFSVVTLLVILASIFMPESLLYENIPVCEYKTIGKECFLCGMTMAFVEISKLNFNLALQLNSVSLLFYSTFMANNLIFLYTLLSPSVKKYESS